MSGAVNQEDRQAMAIHTHDHRTVTIDVIPRISTVIVDGMLHFPSELPLTIDTKRGVTHKIVIEEREINETTDKRYVFHRWTDLSEAQERTITVSENINLRAVFIEQYRAKVISEHGAVYGNGWYDKGAKATFGVKQTVVPDDELEGHRFAFVQWDIGDSPRSPTTSTVIQGPTIARAIWADQYYLEVTSSLEGNVVGGSGWYDKGKKVNLVSNTDVESGIPNTKYVLDGWSSVGKYPAVINAPETTPGHATLTIDNPHEVQAKWKKAYYLDVQTPYGIPVGSGFYKEGSIATISVSRTDVVMEQNKERVVFDGWIGEGLSIIQFGSAQVRVTEPASVVAKWKPQYYLEVSSIQGGSASGSGWYDVGSVVTMAADEPPDKSGFWMKTAFDRWTGDFDGNTAKASIMMDSPKTVKALWKDDYSPAFMNGGILAGVGIGGVVAYRKFRRSKKVRHQRPELAGQKRPELAELASETALPTEWSNPPWKRWHARLVDRTSDDIEQKS